MNQYKVKIYGQESIALIEAMGAVKTFDNNCYYLFAEEFPDAQMSKINYALQSILNIDNRCYICWREFDVGECTSQPEEKRGRYAVHAEKMMIECCLQCAETIKEMTGGLQWAK